MKTIAIFGFGNVGQTLATLFRKAGYDIIICSKDGDNGSEIYTSATYELGIKQADAIALAIPYQAVSDVLTPLKHALSGKIIIECTNPLNDDWSPLLLGQETSAAEQIALIAKDAHVVKAFNTIFADAMAMEYDSVNELLTTAFIAGDDENSKHAVLSLAKRMGFGPLDVGPLMVTRYLEAMAHLNIQIAVGQGSGTQANFVYRQG